AELEDAGLAAALRAIAGARHGEEPVDEQAFDLVARKLGLERAADEARAAAEDGHRKAIGRPGEDLLLGGARGVDERALLPSGALLPDRLGERVRQGEVHVVAAEEDVIADGDAVEDEVAVLLAHRDEREVGGAAADVAHEDDVADR